MKRRHKRLSLRQQRKRTPKRKKRMRRNQRNGDRIFYGAQYNAM